MIESASPASAAQNTTRRIVSVAVVCASWAILSIHPLFKYLSHARAFTALIFGLLSIIVAMTFPDPFHLRQRTLHIGWFLLLLLVLGQAFVTLYPISQRYPLNRGYPPASLPGAMLLAAPFSAVGHIAWQNFFWLGLFFLFTVNFFRYRATALFFLATFLLFAPATLSDFTSGGDYLTNFFYVAIAATLFAHALNRPWTLAIPAAIFLGITLSSRVIYPLILIPLLAFALQRISRSRTAALFTITLITAAAITLPTFAPLPIPRLSVAFALLVACTAFFVPMDLPRLFLIFGVSSLMIIAPAVATFGPHSGYAFFSLSVCSLALSLWALARYESTFSAVPDPTNSL